MSDRILVEFDKAFAWAELPYKISVDSGAAKWRESVVAENFRWWRQSRVSEKCLSWRLARELGWVVPSPVDVTMQPLRDVEISPVSLSSAEMAWLAPRDIWQREGSAIAVDKQRGAWMRLYDFKNGEHWESMFIPNGQGSIEWKLGWRMKAPPDYALLIVPFENTVGLEVIPGVLNHKYLTALSQGAGLAIAIRPLEGVSIARGQPIARIVLLHTDALRVSDNLK
jgi:hypothetical protein